MAADPVPYSEEVCDAICDRIADGEFLRVICRSEGMPSWRTVYKWKDARPEFAEKLKAARKAGYDALAEDSLIMLDEKPERTETQFGSKVDSGHVQWQKNRSDQRLKMLAKWDSGRYGDKVALTDGDGKPLQGAQVAPTFNITLTDGK